MLWSFKQLVIKKFDFFFDQLQVNNQQVRDFIEELISYLENRLAEIDQVTCSYTMKICAIDYSSATFNMITVLVFYSDFTFQANPGMNEFKRWYVTSTDILN